MKRNGYIVALLLLFWGATELLNRVDFWGKDNLQRPHGYFIQGLIFLALLFVLQNFLFNPYLRVLDERDARTIGKKGAAERTKEEAAEILRQYRAELDNARVRALREREGVGIAADEEERRQVAEAKAQAREKFETASEKTQEETTTAREALQRSMHELSSEIVSRVLTVNAGAAKAKGTKRPVEGKQS
jgi:F-type H+-transporting ATPase subunit b